MEASESSDHFFVLSKLVKVLQLSYKGVKEDVDLSKDEPRYLEVHSLALELEFVFLKSARNRVVKRP